MGGDKVFVTGSTTFEIRDYSVVKNILTNGKLIQSDPFTVGGHQWVIRFYPQGISEDYADFASVMLKLLNATQPINAFYTFHLKDWKTSTPDKTTWLTMNRPSTFNTFQSSADTWGYLELIKQSDLETSKYLEDDTLVIKATVWVGED